MSRFRFTFLAICLLLLWLAWSDLSLLLRNPEPASVTISELERQGAPREWLRVSGGVLDLTQAISTSGTLELDALLVPLKSRLDEKGFKVLVETHDPALLECFRTYYFLLETAQDQRRYLEEHEDDFYRRQEVTGMLPSSLVASGNRDRLMQLASDTGMEVSPDTIFISQGKEPARWRGILFLALGLAGLVKFISLLKTGKPATPASEEAPGEQ